MDSAIIDALMKQFGKEEPIDEMDEKLKNNKPKKSVTVIIGSGEHPIEGAEGSTEDDTSDEDMDVGSDDEMTEDDIDPEMSVDMQEKIRKILKKK